MLRWHVNRPLFAHSFGSVSGAGIGGLAFSPVNGLPSTVSFGPPWLSFDRFVGTIPLCDSLPPFLWVLSLIAFTHRSASKRGCGWQQGLSVLAREVSIHAWGLRLRSAGDTLAFARAPCCLPVALTPSAH